MKSTITGFTVEAKLNKLSEEEIKSLEIFSGKNAGICYMGESYFESKVTDPDAALKRFNGTVKINHHSISGHCKITLLFEGITKMMAIILNSLQWYDTSEKSGRYTVMTAGSEREQELYDKWKFILQDRITFEYPEMPEAQIVKMAQENARYFLSVFTPATTMSYTTSLRQWNYIYDWCDNFVKEKEELTQSTFDIKLTKDVKAIRDLIIEAGLYVDILRDNKDRHLSFLAIQTDDIINYYKDNNDLFTSVYRTSYEASFVQIAQAQRHRTLKYYMFYDGTQTPNYFVPPILREKDLIDEWNKDMKSVEDLTPQGTKFKVIETGELCNFLLKCDERLCGRAQLEICLQTADTLSKYIQSTNFSNSPIPNDYYDLLIGEERGMRIVSPCAKCEILGGCKEPCMFGARKAFTRLV